MFEGLNAIPWAELQHAYGSAEEVPVWLRQLASDDEQVRQRAMGRLGGSLEHQGGIYPATAYAVPYLIALLEEPANRGKYEILGWLAAFYRASPLDEKMWYGDEGTESYGAWGGMPRHIPYKDTHATIEAGMPLYLRLLDAPVLIDRLEAAHLLIHFFARAQDLWPTLQAALEREPTEAGQADLVLELGRLAKQLPEKQSFFLERFQTAQSELVRFAAALVVARLAKAATPEEVMHLLVRVMLEAPSSLDLYLRFPCGGTYPWSAALWALSNLGPARLADLAPVLEERLAKNRDAYVLEQMLFVRLLLFIVFAEPAHHGHPARSAEALTAQQRQSLLVLLEQEQLWHDSNFLGLLRAYGVPATRKDLSAYLGREASAELTTAETPNPWTRRTEHPSKVRADRYHEVLKAAFPDVFIYKYGGPGLQREDSQEDDVMEINDGRLFRFPRHAEAVEAMEREIALLRILQDHLPLPIPNPKHSSQGTREVGRAFMGFVSLPGKPFSKGLLECVDGEETVQHLAEQLASFLWALHQVPLAQVAHLALPPAPNRKAIEALYLMAREDLFSQMPQDRQTQISDQFEAFLGTPEQFVVTPVLVHGNFGPETVLYAAKERRISGVIDFSHACLGDPALDFARLVGPAGYSEDFLQRWVPIYPELPALLPRAKFYAVVVNVEEEVRQRGEQEQRAATPSPFPEIDRIFRESPKLRAGEDETPIGGYFY
jgi:aminoglycoside 2''-phosphotransferase